MKKSILLLLSPLYIGENRSIEMFSDLLRITHLVIGRARTWSQAVWLQSYPLNDYSLIYFSPKDTVALRMLGCSTGTPSGSCLPPVWMVGWLVGICSAWFIVGLHKYLLSEWINSVRWVRMKGPTGHSNQDLWEIAQEVTETFRDLANYCSYIHSCDHGNISL